MAAPWGRECSRNRGISPIILGIGQIGSGRRLGLDRQGMNIGAHQIIDRRVHQPVALQWRDSAKGLRHDLHPEMSPAVSSAHMPLVPMALILDMQLNRAETGLQTLSDALYAVRSAAHGVVSSGTGRSLVLSQIACGTMNSIKAMVIPHNLKLTQVFSEKFRAT